MTLTTGTSTEIEEYLRREAVEAVVHATDPGTFGDDLPPIQDMPTLNSVLYAIEADLETAKLRCEYLGRRGWVDTLEELVNEILQEIAEEQP